MSLDSPVVSCPFENYMFTLNFSVHRFSLHSLPASHLNLLKVSDLRRFPQSRCY